MTDVVRYDNFDAETADFVEKLIRVFADIALRLSKLEAIGDDLQEIEQRYGVAALERINAVILPAIANVQLVLDDAADQLALFEQGAPNSAQLGGELPAYYLDLMNATGVLGVDQGGTGGTTQAEAIAALGITPAAIGTLTAAQIATDISAAINALIDGAPGTLDTLNEIAAAFGDDPNFLANLSQTAATVAEFFAATSGALMLTPEIVWDAAAEVNLGGSSNITPNMSTFVNGSITLTGNRTLNNPTNVVVGRTGYMRVNRSGGNDWTLSFGSQYKFLGNTVPVLSTDAGAEDLLMYHSLSSTRILIIPAYNVDL